MELPRQRGLEPSGQQPGGTGCTARRQDLSLNDGFGGCDCEASIQRQSGSANKACWGGEVWGSSFVFGFCSNRTELSVLRGRNWENTIWG